MEEYDHMNNQNPYGVDHYRYNDPHAAGPQMYVAKRRFHADGCQNGTEKRSLRSKVVMWFLSAVLLVSSGLLIASGSICIEWSQSYWFRRKFPGGYAIGITVCGSVLFLSGFVSCCEMRKYFPFWRITATAAFLGLIGLDIYLLIERMWFWTYGGGWAYTQYSVFAEFFVRFAARITLFVMMITCIKYSSARAKTSEGQTTLLPLFFLVVLAMIYSLFVLFGSLLESRRKRGKLFETFIFVSSMALLSSFGSFAYIRRRSWWHTLLSFSFFAYAVVFVISIATARQLENYEKLNLLAEIGFHIIVAVTFATVNDTKSNPNEDIKNSPKKHQLPYETQAYERPRDGGENEQLLHHAQRKERSGRSGRSGTRRKNHVGGVVRHKSARGYPGYSGQENNALQGFVSHNSSSEGARGVWV